MNHFTIKDIENLTGIKSHTLRIWEQRYGIPNPKRTDTNIRYYDDQDLKLLLNVSLLNKQGHKISHLTSLTKEELEKLALAHCQNVDDTSIQLDSLMKAMFNLDEAAFEKILSSHLLNFGLEHTMSNLFFPFLKRIGILWQTGQVNPAYEHFMSNLIRQKLVVAIDTQVITPVPDAKKFVLFLPEGEMHELGLLLANYILRARGHQTIYLGQNLPYTDLESILGQYQFDCILSVLTSSTSKITTQEMLDDLSKRLRNKTIYVTGSQVTAGPELKVPSNVRILQNVAELIEMAEAK